MTGSILIVEDDTDIAELMRVYMERDGFAAHVVTSGEGARAALSEAPWNLVLLDINLPGVDGFELLQEIRQTSQVPVIIVTARQEESDAVYGLGAGADEYVTKPFSPRVLVARARALLRRSTAGQEQESGSESGSRSGGAAHGSAPAHGSGSSAAGSGSSAAVDSSAGESSGSARHGGAHGGAGQGRPGGPRPDAGPGSPGGWGQGNGSGGRGDGSGEVTPVRRVGEIEVNVETEQVYWNGTEIRLAPKEYALLKYLIERAGRPATPADIYAAVWDNAYGDLSSVAVHVQRLRRKIERDPSEPEYIVTRHGYGYVLGVLPEETE
jgi:DNA-binding response OmpR family regulator